MRTFIVMRCHARADFPDQPDISLEMYPAETVVELIGLIRCKWGSDSLIYEGLIETEIWNWLAESNGDGDDYWMIGEIVLSHLVTKGSELKMLLE